MPKGEAEWQLTPTGVFWGNNLAVDLVATAPSVVSNGMSVAAQGGQQ